MGNKQLLVESFKVKPEEYKKIPLTESSILIEGKEYNCTAAYTFPISRPNQENLNGRIYSGKLWEGVISRKEGENSFGLCDHPSDGGSVKDSFCVWHNIRMNESKQLVVADAYLFGDWGRHAQEALDAGGELGMSSVGYGEFDKDGKTINENSYELHRPADWVLDPSYQVFGNKGDEIASEEVVVNEDVTSEEDSSEEIINEKIDEENSMKNKLEENMFRLQMEGVLSKAKDVSNLKERIVSLQKHITFFEADICPDLKKEFEAEIALAEAGIHELADKGIKLDETVVEKEEAIEKAGKLDEEITALTEENVKLKSSFEEVAALADSLKELVKESTASIDVLENKIKTSFTAEEVLKIQKDFEEKIAVLEADKKDDKKDDEEEKKADDDMTDEEKAAAKEKADKEKEDKAKDEKKEEVSEDIIPEGTDAQVAGYYEKMREAHPAVVKIKEELLACKTLLEAQHKFIKLKSVIFESAYRSSSTFSDPEEIKEEVVVEKVLRTLPKIKKTLKKHEGWM